MHRYETELRKIHWNSILKGAAFGLLTGWNGETDINEPEIFEDSNKKGQTIDINGDIHFHDVNFTYPNRSEVSALRNLTLVARAGETTALVGPSGCGKSTCISLLLRFYEPASGQITINGHSIDTFNVKQLRQNIAVVSQEPILLSTSIYENIRYGKENATKAEIEEAARQANAHDFIIRLLDKYETRIGENGTQLSGGEKQRLALARALVKQPTVLLLDEATSALDYANEKIVQQSLDQACKGRTTIVITHDLKTIRNAHRIYVLTNGHVIEQGQHEKLMADERSIYRETVKIQQAETTEDDTDTIMNQAIVEDDDKQKTIVEGSRLLSDDDKADVDQSLSSESRRPIFVRLISMNSPEWKIILIGCLACLASGASQSVFAILLSKIIDAFGECDYVKQRRHVFVLSSLLLVIGAVILCIHLIQFIAFAWSGSKLTQRIRIKAFEQLLCQEVAYFERPENSSGAICNRLSSEALAIQQMVTSRLSIVCDASATFGFGLLLGFFLNWQLALVFFIFHLFVLILVFIQIKWQARINKRSHRLIGQASSLAVEVIHNMRTIKQLAIEKALVKQFSQLLYDELITRRKDTIISALLNGIYWGFPSFIVAFIYWYGLKLVEHHQINLKNMVMYYLRFRHFIFRILSSRFNLGYETRAGLKGGHLSGGEKQRIAIARILLRRPKVFLLDEITSAMDAKNQQIVQETLEQIQLEESNQSFLIIAHRLSTISSCDQICVLDKGFLIESGTHTELMQRRAAYYQIVMRTDVQ
ncbi:unnamed protein product [Rotaria sp. Silwood1]|nr:unnamed protein product [Rotaria sp. Silwood1]CAF1421074.1 unnamed protein product [Rotaria sp. Silwood1]